MKIFINGANKTARIGTMSFVTDDDANGEELSFDAIDRFACGDIVTVNDEGKTQFSGSIVDMEEGKGPPYSYRCRDFSQNMSGDVMIQLYKIQADQALKKLFENYGIQGDVCKIPTKITKIYKCPMIDAVKDILTKAKDDQGKAYYFEVRGKKIIVEEKKKKRIYPEFLIGEDHSISRSIEERKNKVVVSTSGDGGKVLAIVSNPESIKRYGTLQANAEVDDSDSNIKAKTKAKNMLKNLDKQKNSASITLLVTKGYWEIRKNRIIRMNTDRLRGWYWIQQSEHVIEEGTHKVTVTLEWGTK